MITSVTGIARSLIFLDAGMVLAHPFVIGELALGDLRQRLSILTAVSNLPQASVATDIEAVDFIGRHRLFGRGIGYIDVHLLAATRLTANAAFWTHDKRLRSVAEQIGLAMTTVR